MTVSKKFAAAVMAAVLASPAVAAPPSSATVERTDSGALLVRWTGAGPVDVLIADKPEAGPRQARLVSARDADGTEVVPGDAPRSYVLLRDPASGKFLRVAERLVPLEHGSNFRDIGGYALSGGRHVRWGLIYRSGGTPLLDDADLARVKALGLATMVDLRSSEERVLAPSRIQGVPYQAVGYSMASLNVAGGMGATYKGLPLMLKPQLRLLFTDLLRGEGPVAFNCSAGQDRTGFAAAMVLSALGAPRDTILADYHLSTVYRRPANEMPKIDPAVAAGNPVAAMFASYQRPEFQKPTPLKTADGKAFLSFAFEEIEARWGSVDNYLRQELGIGAAERKRLRELYSE